MESCQHLIITCWMWYHHTISGTVYSARHKENVYLRGHMIWVIHPLIPNPSCEEWCSNNLPRNMILYSSELVEYCKEAPALHNMSGSCVTPYLDLSIYDRLPTTPRSRIAACVIRLVDLKVVCMGSHAIVHQLRCGKFRCSHDRQVAIPTKCSCAESERTSGRLAMECSISTYPMLYGIVERKSNVCLRSNDCLIIS